MSRTYKSAPLNARGGYAAHRDTKGWRRAAVAEARSVPPDSYQDLRLCSIVNMPFHIAHKMLLAGWNPYDVRDSLMAKYGLRMSVARSLVELALGWSDVRKAMEKADGRLVPVRERNMQDRRMERMR